MFFENHNFFGPGQSDYSLSPVDKDDEISKSHDLDYEKATSFEDIKKADTVAIKRFLSDAPYNWHSLVGAVGLSIKTGTERLFNTMLYPRKLPVTGGKQVVGTTGRGRKTKQTKDSGIGESLLQSTIPMEEVSRDMFEDQTPVASSKRTKRAAEGVGAISDVNSGNSGSIDYLQAPIIDTETVTFEHLHLLNTWGNGFKIFTIGTKEKAKLMTTSLAAVPVQLTCFWLNYAEYSSLPPGSSIVSVEMLIVPRGIKSSFTTNSSIAGSANNSQCIFGQCAEGLNLKFAIRNVKLERDPAAPMHITNFKVPHSIDVAQRLWGNGKWSSDFDSCIPTIVGIPRALNYYLGLLHPYFSDEEKKKAMIRPGWPELNKYARMFNFVNHIDVPVINYKYNVKTNVIRPKFSHVIDDDATWHTYKLGGENFSLYTGQWKDGKFKIDEESNLAPLSFKVDSYDDYTKLQVEQSSTISLIDHTPQNSGHIMPSVHIGILPVQTNDPDSENLNFVASCATWEIKTKCTVKINLNSSYTNISAYTPDQIPLGKILLDDTIVYKNSLLRMTPYNKTGTEVETPQRASTAATTSAIPSSIAGPRYHTVTSR